MCREENIFVSTIPIIITIENSCQNIPKITHNTPSIIISIFRVNYNNTLKRGCQV